MDSRDGKYGTDHDNKRGIHPSFASVRGLVGKAAMLTLLCGATVANAGTAGSITFGPVSVEPVPALGTAMAILLAMMLAFMGLVAIKRKAGVLPAIGTLAAGTALLGLVGAPVVERAVSAGASNFITQPTQTFPVISDVNFFTNNLTGPARVLSLTPPSGCSATAAVASDNGCKVGSDVAPTETCEVDCTSGGDT